MTAREITPVIFFGTDNRFIDEDLTLAQFSRLKDFRPHVVPASTPAEPSVKAGDVAPKVSTVTAPATGSRKDSNGSQATPITVSPPENSADPAPVVKVPNGDPGLIPPLGN